MKGIGKHNRKDLAMREKRKDQASKSTSSKKAMRKRDISHGLPYSEFPAATGTFTGLAISLLIGVFGVCNTYATEGSITISLRDSVNLNLLGGDTEGSFGKSTVATASVETTNFTGYTLTIEGGNDDGALTGMNNSANRIPSIASVDANVDEETFRTGSKYMNTWGFRPGSIYNGTTTLENNNYQVAPTHDNPLTMDVTRAANWGYPKEYTLALAAKVNSEIPNDSYTGTFTLAATGNHYNYHIGYTDNSNSIPDDQIGEGVTDGSVTLSSVTPTKDGFVFQGWCAQETTVNPATHETTCPSGATVYSVGQTVELNGESANNMLLYAIWSKGYNTFAEAFNAFHKSTYEDTGYYTMQDMTSEICDSIVIGSPSLDTADGINANTLIDTRNKKTYLVAKYADGHCWMRENLNLLMTAGSGIEAYNFETKSTFTYTPEQYGTTQTDTGTAWNEDASDGARSFQQNKDDCIGGTNISQSGGTGEACDALRPYERIGVLYNWAAATAQTGNQAKNAGASGEQVIPTSICPKGWRLPANSGDYSFSTLMGSYGLPTANQYHQGYSGQLQNPLNFNRPGYYAYGNGALKSRGTDVGFWSSMGYSTTYVHYLSFGPTYFFPQDTNGKGHGFPVRCVAV